MIRFERNPQWKDCGKGLLVSERRNDYFRRTLARRCFGVFQRRSFRNHEYRSVSSLFSLNRNVRGALFDDLFGMGSVRTLCNDLRQSYSRNRQWLHDLDIPRPTTEKVMFLYALNLIVFLENLKMSFFSSFGVLVVLRFFLPKRNKKSRRI